MVSSKDVTIHAGNFTLAKKTSAENSIKRLTGTHIFLKDPNGNVEILMPFWAFKWELAEDGFVPALLIYADLVATGDARAIEAAEIIYDKYIARLVRKDR